MKKAIDPQNHQSALECVLDSFVEAAEPDIALFNDLVSCMRPRRARDCDAARHAIYTLCFVLEHREDYRVALRGALWRLLSERRQQSLYTDVGIFPNNGFFTEVTHRFVRSTLLPDLFDLCQLRDVIAKVFKRASDHVWVRDVGVGTWTDLLRALRFDEAPGEEGAREAPDAMPPLRQLLEALRVLSYRIAAIGLEPEVCRHDPTLDSEHSPFIAQNQEMLAYLARFETSCGAAPASIIAHCADADTDTDTSDLRASGTDKAHLVVLLDQCREVGDRIRRRAAHTGTSVSLTLHLLRLKQHLARAELLIDVADALRQKHGAANVLPMIAELASELIQAECCRNNLRDYFRQNVELIALRVTENAGHAGEHYIASSRKDYFALLRSALLGGIIIACMSALKFVIAGCGWTPLNESIGFGLNYGLGFVLIHILRGTVATKQPAMTAHALAAAIKDSSRKGGRDLDHLVTLIVRTMRSQTAAIFGNVALAVPVAMLIGFAYRQVIGHSFLSPERATHLLGEVAFKPSTLIYAAIAGICLFLAGQINGYCDNVCAYERIPERIMHIRWARRLFGERHLWRIANYVGGNLGALIGNFVFGFMLSSVWGLGMLFGLPLDIRHVAFASTYSGFASVSLDFAVPHTLLLAAMAGTWAIGAINLLVSFSLAMWVALRARNVSFAETRRLFGDVLRHLRNHPREFVFPPRSPLVARSDASGGPG
ncbi:site-specific recombinase [Paraburkholderia tagetis]|uniref:Site-specific recombinase n=1 Tax=Paraburkholderia tagetis TaxID=2913261 RepID=A0A9X1UL46_9BURK|nr:site-specific recombinase [Paraburkholderia tagetis]MCG5077362.1 site-specific recombinase [Paraburkholderia tagetis]